MSMMTKSFTKGALLGMSALACAAFVSASPASARAVSSNAAAQAVGGQSVAVQDQATAALNARGAQIATREGMPQKLTFQIALVSLPGGPDAVQHVISKVPQGAGFQQVASYLTQALPKTKLAIVPPSGIVMSWNGHMVADIVFVERIPYVSAAGDISRDLFMGQGEVGGCQANGQPLVVNGITLSSPACSALLQLADVPHNDQKSVIGGNLANFGTRMHIDITNDEMAGNKIGGHMQVINVSPVRFEKIERHDMTITLPIKTANTLDKEFIAPKGAATLMPLGYNKQTHSRLAVLIQPNNAQ